MENNQQRIIFDVQGDMTSAEIMLGILKKNGVKDATEDLIRSPENSKLLFFSNTVKDFFDKKLSEKNMTSLFQTRLKIAEGDASGMLNDVKKMLIPFAKKINISSEEGEEEIIATPPKPAGKVLPKKQIEEIVIKKPKAINNITEQKQPEIKKISNTGPDNYREPIE